MEKARGDFINLLIEYRKIKNHDITIVFDGYKSGDKEERLSVVGGIRIIFSRLGEKADDVIKRIISKEKRGWLVISSDKEIASYAWSFNCVPIFSDTFLSRIIRQIKDNNSNEDSKAKEMIVSKDDGEDSDYLILRGNPHKPSKKQKAVRRALSKL